MTASWISPRDDGRLRRPWNTDPSIPERLTRPTVEEVKVLRRNVACPTLVHSEFHLPDANQSLAADFVRGETAVIHGSGHNVAVEQTGSTIGLIDEFIATR